MSEATERAQPATPAAPPNLSGQVSRAMLWNAVLQPARLLAVLISSLVLINGLAREAYGMAAILGALAGLLGLVADIGVERALVKFLPEIEERHGREGVRRALQLVIWQKLAVLALIVAAAFALREPFFAYWRGKITDPALLALFNEYRWAFFGALMALIVFGALFDVYMQALVAYFRQRAWASITVVQMLLRPLLLAGVVLIGWGVLGVLGALVAIPVIVLGLAAWQATTLRRTLATRPTKAAAGARLPARFLAYCALSFWIQLTEYFYSLEFLILFLPNAATIAGFKVASSLVNQVLTALWSPMTGVQIPLFTRLYARDDERQLGEAYALLSKFLAALLIPATVGLTVLAGNLLALLYEEYADFATVARILTIFLCLDAAISVPLSILMAYERYRPMLLARTLALVAIPLVLFAVPRYGAIGAALVMGGVRLACDGLAMGLALRLLPLRYPWAFAGRVALASAAMAAVVAPPAFSVLAPPAALSLTARALYALGTLALGGLGALVYLGAFRLLGGLDDADRRRIRELRLPVASALLRFF
jgi:O-antigen/teichoic acid export membrane protein